MMATTFPSLLRQTKFASYDPLIHRIYTSPTASAAKGDWGLKYSLPPTKRDRSQYRNIKVQSLDAGQGLGCDYKPGETEARFMERWGNGRYGWMSYAQADAANASNTLDDFGLSGGSSSSIFIERQSNKNDKRSIKPSALVEQPSISRSEQEKVDPIVDLEFMSEERFEAYLEEIRSRRGQMLAWKQENASVARRAAEAQHEAEAGGPSFIPASEEKTPKSLWEEVAANKIPIGEAAEFRSAQISKDMKANTSGSTITKSAPLMPFSHPTGGLAYGNFAPADSSHPLTSLPGRSLAKVSNAQDFYRGNSDATTRSSFKNSRDNEQIIGIGGITVIEKGSTTPPFSPSEYETTAIQNRKVDQGTFRITSATIDTLPTIVASSARTGKKTILPSDLNTRFRKASPATGAKPLDGFGFKVLVQNKGEDDKRWKRINDGAVVMGEKKWVAADGIEVHERPASDALSRGIFEKDKKTEVESRFEAKGAGSKGGANTFDMLKEILKDTEGWNPDNKSGGYRSGRPNKPVSSFANRRGYSTSTSTSTSTLSLTRRAFSTSSPHSSPNESKPTASVTPEQMKGNAKILGPGVGGTEGEDGSPEKPGDDLVKGEWREIEENVAGDVRYGKQAPEGTEKK